MPVRSMTGFGAAAREGAGVEVRAEVRTVNHRSLAVAVRSPGWTEGATAAVEAAAKRRMSRGSVSVHLTVSRTGPAAPARIQADVFADYLLQLDEAMSRVRTLPVTAGDILRLPGVVTESSPDALSEAEAAVIAEAADAALAEAVTMREREGAALAAELRGILDEIERGAAEAEALAPAAVLAARDRMRERVAQLLAPGQTIPEELIARETALLADKADVAEEIARLRSHVAQARSALGEDGAVGRRLDFLTQEFGREVNTIGSKSQDVAIARLVVSMKVAVERLKEQAANLE
ncbi:MAG: hypothetical protein HMLKMBBP_01767 [Planctomycetes bacterium]|nr:hypothetical protein [Planctomycetota bacterium]